ncbi:D-alanyl-D-alanine carboxypeptidase family protein [Vagococcus fluvialis]|uniref:D-alanyl-D-alanine carboxypeptidase family protein n=1 Tax=Vagococcus fluvialis TaxID=2738 RepID=UPI003B2241F4
MKKILSLLVICIVLGGGGYYVWATKFNDGFSDIIKTSETSKIKLPSDIHSKTILLQNLSTGEMLIEKNETKEVEIASLTKLITAYLLLEAETNLEKTVTIDQRIIDDLMTEGASLSGYRSGDELTIEDLAYGIVLPSGEDAALVAANYVAGSEKAFVEKMNQLAKELKMTNTHFKNSIGLDARNHYSTVEDLSKFMNVALKNQNFRKLVTTTTYQTDGTTYTPEGYYVESTMLKDSVYLSIANGQILGGKTGYTKKQGNV